MDIYIETTEGSKKSIRIPWLPEKIQVVGNGSRLSSYEIIHMGEINLPNGNTLKEFRWESKLPGAKHKNLPFLRGKWQDPKDIQKTLDSWKDKSTPLKLTITGTPIATNVYLVDFNITYEGAYGDYSYEILLKSRRADIKIEVKKGKSSSSNSGKSGTKTYTIKKKDSLWSIAKKFLGKSSRWKEIYKLNKSIIEKTAKKHKRKDSKNGHYIYPGTKIKIPKK